jgi:hypothetical protein
MQIKDRVKSDYFNWIYGLMCDGRFAENITYKKLFKFLHDVEFEYFVPYDENRAADGIALRYRFCLIHGCEELEKYLTGPCSVLEMMVALAIRCEDIVDDPDKGDRTSQWFWGMISNLGLNSMTDSIFNDWLVNDVIARLLERDYEPDGRGGLFTVKGWNRDMRTAEIWHQLMAYINSIM